jgi:hypothetical protein
VTVLALPTALAYLGLSGDNADRDAKLTTMIAAAVAAIGERVGPLEPVETTVRVKPSYVTLVIPTPAVSITSVTDAVGTVLDVSGLHLEQRAGLITNNDGTSFRSSWYDVVFLRGRETCPDDLVEAVLELVRHMWDTQRGPTRPGAKDSESMSNKVPGAAYTFPFRVTELLAPYMRPGVRS